MADILDTLVTDRTLEDVERAYYLENLWGQRPNGDIYWTGTQAEYNEWKNDPRGEYRLETLNRVESAVEFVADLLYEAGSSVTVQTKTDWEEIDPPAFDKMSRYLSNLHKIRDALPLPMSIPEVPEDMDELTHDEANDIEKILFEVGKQAKKIALTRRHCGAPTCGLEDLVR